MYFYCHGHSLGGTDEPEATGLLPADEPEASATGQLLHKGVDEPEATGLLPTSRKRRASFRPVADASR